ncbi:dnaJ homolog subfamily C member 15 isoform X2 [Calonectris borealis]|uniref:dnaJ homolog subfamily C member 15 isoform X2 n=1 Tax=Calonectris borealis TaxID=1323832 RepID=UPI003F4C1632
MEGAAASPEGLRYAEYTRVPTGAGKGQAELDRGLARTMIAIGLGVATVAFAGRYAFHLWKPLEQAITETAKRISTSCLLPFQWRTVLVVEQHTEFSEKFTTSSNMMDGLSYGVLNLLPSMETLIMLSLAVPGKLS